MRKNFTKLLSIILLASPIALAGCVVHESTYPPYYHRDRHYYVQPAQKHHPKPIRRGYYGRPVDHKPARPHYNY